MKKAMGMMFAASIVLNASISHAAYATAFSRAVAYWMTVDENGDAEELYSSDWSTADTAETCGSNCRRYSIGTVLPVDSGTGYPVYKVELLYARVYRNGTDGTDEYISFDWDFLDISGDWGDEDYCNPNGYEHEGGRRYYARRNYSSPYLPVDDFDYEIRINYAYTANVSGERQFNFYYTPSDS